MLKAGQMDEPTATLKSERDLIADKKTIDFTLSEQPRVGAMRFIYPSGSRPLPGYTIKRGIGIGAFGEVYLAKNASGKEVALKHIQRHHELELRGVREVINLNHRNLVYLIEVKEDEHGAWWVVMEYVMGKTLQDVIEDHPQGMPDQLVRRVFMGIEEGLEYLHDRGIVHRDLKPANIFAGEAVNIGDYGLSKAISGSGQNDDTVDIGTVHYMAPEIGKGNYTNKIDVYALGVVLYEMLTGKVPFDGETRQEIIMRHMMDPPDLTSVPTPYRKIIAGALEKDPAKRYPTVGQMVKDYPTVKDDEPRPPVVTLHSADVADGGTCNGPVTMTFTSTEPTCNFTEAQVTLANATLDSWSKVSSTLYTAIITPTSSSPLVVVEAGKFTDAAGNDNMVSNTYHWTHEHDDQIKKRITELVGSLLMSALVMVVLGVVSMILGGVLGVDPVGTWASTYAWITLPGLLGAWTILIANKFREGQKPDPALRGFAMLVMGLGVGAASFGLFQWLLLGPLLPLHCLGYFAGLFVLLPFWKYTDPARTARFARGSTVATLFSAWFLELFLHVPWGMFIVGMIAVAVQLAAPWTTPGERARIRKLQKNSI